VARVRCRFGTAVLAALLGGAGVWFLAVPAGRAPAGAVERVERPPAIRPDFTGLTLPPNIAPLNFRIEEEASRFFVNIHSRRGPAIGISSRSGRISIPRNPWRRLLEANRGQDLFVDVYAEDPRGRWRRFRTITHRIAEEDIDGFVAYRNMHPARSSWTMSLHARDLGRFDETEFLRYDSGFEAACVNCHTPRGNRPDLMLIGIRSKRFGASTLLIENRVPRKIGAQFGYASWHPSGRLAVYSVNDFPIFFHSARGQIHDTVDRDSYLACFRPDRRTLRPCPPLARKERLENWPAWSPDGRYLYYCAAPKLWEDTGQTPPERYREVRYDLERISYDLEADRWGPVETVLSSAATGKSAAMPRVSPDGRWLSFCLIDHGFFPNWREESDLYLVDLEAAGRGGTFGFRRMELNSDRSESWHSWSSNGRWLAFSSKRDHGIFTRIYLAYVDREGRAHKPFLLPQEDPDFYESCLLAFNTPEFLTGPVPCGRGRLEGVVGGAEALRVDAVTLPTPKGPGGPPRASGEWE